MVCALSGWLREGVVLEMEVGKWLKGILYVVALCWSVLLLLYFHTSFCSNHANLSRI